MMIVARGAQRRGQKINMATEIPRKICRPNVLFVLPYGVNRVSYLL